MDNIQNFTGQYPLSKTLQFKLIPQGKTLEHFTVQKFLDADKGLEISAEKVKGIADRVYRHVLDECFSGVSFSGLKDYAELYYKPNRSPEEKKKMGDMERDLRNQITERFKAHPKYKTLFQANVISEYAYDYVSDDADAGKEERKALDDVNGFTSYFTSYFKNRANIFSNEAKHTAAAYRVVNENLPIFLDNIKAYEKIKEVISDDVDMVNEVFEGNYPAVSENVESIDDFFSLDFFSCFTNQKSIDLYNMLIGGYSKDHEKVKGLNEYINLCAQKKKIRLPLLKRLHKMILSNADSVSFLPPVFESDNALLQSVDKFFAADGQTSLKKTEGLFSSLDSYDRSAIHYSSRNLPDLSKHIFGSWETVRKKWEEEYDNKERSAHPKKKFNEKYYGDRSTAFRNCKSFSLAWIEMCGSEDVPGYIADSVTKAIDTVKEAYAAAKDLVTNEYTYEKQLCKNEMAIGRIKDLLDSFKEVERMMLPFKGEGREPVRDGVFYGELEEIIDIFHEFDKMYDMVRNYLTKKPYSKDKIKLNFGKPTFLGGWDINKEEDCRGTILKKDGGYYLAVLVDGKAFQDMPIAEEGCACYEKMVYKLIPGAAKYFGKCVPSQNPPDRICRILDKKKAKVELTENETKELVDYLANDFLVNCPNLLDKSGKNYFNFKFKGPAEYASFNEFCEDVDRQNYSISFRHIPVEYVDQLVEEGRILLFQIWCKDFSEYSTGTPNLHTMIFKAMFDTEHGGSSVFRLCGEAEVYFRPKRLKLEETTIHKPGDVVDNKNKRNNNKYHKFTHEVIKDRRFTEDQFSLHLAVAINYTQKQIRRSDEFNARVIEAIHNGAFSHVIGIDRGERNLIYITVYKLASKKLVLEKSMNVISDYDYQELLSRKQEDRKDARKNWQTVESIKVVKEGYLSQVVNEIQKLVLKYNAVIAIEDLSDGFMKLRTNPIEKAVYKKFETMLCNKLQCVIDKHTPVDQAGGLYHPLQFVCPDASENQKQNGIIFKVTAWGTSKTDPITGFMNMLRLEYKNIEDSKAFFGKFKEIGYSADEDEFYFTFNYDNFERAEASYVREWTVWTHGDRITHIRDRENGNHDDKIIKLTKEMKALFQDHSIDINSDLKAQILEQDNAQFFKTLTWLLKCTLQMRNSASGKSSVPATDHLISPVKGSDGTFFDSRTVSDGSVALLPTDADANGAYNIARKGALVLSRIMSSEEFDKKMLFVSNKDWLEYAQK